MKTVTYSCNLCGVNLFVPNGISDKTSEGVGIEFVYEKGGQRLVCRVWSDTERHLCLKCLGDLVRIWEERQ
jgi:hypothetical protein